MQELFGWRVGEGWLGRGDGGLGDGGVGGKVGRGWGGEQEEEGVWEGWWDWDTWCKVSCWGHADFPFSKERCCIMSIFLLRKLLSNKDRESIFEKN